MVLGERCLFLTGLAREVAEAEQFSGIAVALIVSPKKKKRNRVGKGFRGGGGRWVQQMGTALALGCRDRGLGAPPLLTAHSQEHRSLVRMFTC